VRFGDYHGVCAYAPFQLFSPFTDYHVLGMNVIVFGVQSHTFTAICNNTADLRTREVESTRNKGSRSDV
jgi:hypothetical protein